MNELSIYKRDDVTINLVVKNSAGVAIDITGYKFWFTAKVNKDDVDASALIQVSVTDHTNPTEGETSIQLSKINTNITPGNYYYDIQMKDNMNKILTLVSSTIEIKQDITITTL